MEMPKNYMEVVKFNSEYKKDHPNQRFGQAFCNAFNVQCEDLFYTEDNYEALSIIEEMICNKVGPQVYWGV